jgi:hypothetical protein
MGFKSLAPSAILECKHGCVQQIQTSASGLKPDDKTLEPFLVKNSKLAGCWAMLVCDQFCLQYAFLLLILLAGQCDFVEHHPDSKNWWGVWNKIAGEQSSPVPLLLSQ